METERPTRKELLKQIVLMGQVSATMRTMDEHKTYKLPGSFVHNIADGIDTWRGLFEQLLEDIPSTEVITELGNGS